MLEKALSKKRRINKVEAEKQEKNKQKSKPTDYVPKEIKKEEEPKKEIESKPQDEIKEIPEEHDIKDSAVSNQNENLVKENASQENIQKNEIGISNQEKEEVHDIVNKNNQSNISEAGRNLNQSITSKGYTKVANDYLGEMIEKVVDECSEFNTNQQESLNNHSVSTPTNSDQMLTN